MRRLTVVVLVAGLTLIATQALSYQHDYTKFQRHTCRFQRNNGWQKGEVQDTILCATKQWSVSGGYSKAYDVAQCESGFGSQAYNPSGYAGVYQHSVEYWPTRQNSYDKAKGKRWNIAESVFNARANVIVAIRMAHGGGWSPWSCA
jgi:hypothetical protein